MVSVISEEPDGWPERDLRGELADALLAHEYGEARTHDVSLDSGEPLLAICLETVDALLPVIRPYLPQTMRESGEEMVPKWSLDSQIQISNDLRTQLEACQKRLMDSSSFLGVEGVRAIPEAEAKALFAPFGCEECGCSVNFHAPSCSKHNEIEVEKPHG